MHPVTNSGNLDSAHRQLWHILAILEILADFKANKSLVHLFRSTRFVLPTETIATHIKTLLLLTMLAGTSPPLFRVKLACWLTINHPSPFSYKASALVWVCPLEQLDYEYYLPMFFDGIRCLEEPCTTLARQVFFWRLSLHHIAANCDTQIPVRQLLLVRVALIIFTDLNIESDKC